MESYNHAFSPDIVTCPTCESSQVSKKGRHRGKQRYLCKNCKRQFQETISFKGGAIPDELRATCAFLYIQGSNFHEIERKTGVCHTTLSRWFKDPPVLSFSEVILALKMLKIGEIEIEVLPITPEIMLYKAVTIRNCKLCHDEAVPIESADEEYGFAIEIEDAIIDTPETEQETK